MECERSVLTGHISETCFGDNNVHGLGLSIKRYLRQGNSSSVLLPVSTVVYSPENSGQVFPDSVSSSLFSYPFPSWDS